MMKTFALALMLALGCTAAFADDDDDKVPAADMERSRPRSPSSAARTAKVSRRKKRASTRSTMPSARWARWTSSSTRTSRFFLSRAIRLAAGRSRRELRVTSTRVDQPKDGPDLRPVFFFASRLSCRLRDADGVKRSRGRRQALNCEQLRILLCTSARVCATLQSWRPTLCISGRQDQRMRLPWPRSMPKPGAAPIAGSSRISRLSA
jgi:hypothetical protein